jgi:plastocyanin
MLEEIWNGVLDLTAQFVMPDWGGLIALMPVGIFALALIVILIQVRRLATAPPARRGKGRVEPRTPAGVHMPGPSWAPVFAAVGAFLLFIGLVFGGITIVLGTIGLVIGLLYWLREAVVIYDRDVEVTETRLPAVVHEGPPPGVHMPGPSFRPLLASLGTALLFAGLVFGGWLLAVGVLALVVSLLGWLNDARKEYVKVEQADVTGHLENLPDPRMPSALLAVFSVLVVGAVLLQTGILPPRQAAGGEEGGEGAAPPPAASGAPPASGEPGSGGEQPAPEADVTLTAQGVAFLETSFEAPADTAFTIAFTNNDAGVQHNVALHEGSPTGPEAWRGDIFPGVETRVYEVPPLPAGEYGFICTVHPQMTGSATLR